MRIPRVEWCGIYAILCACAATMIDGHVDSRNDYDSKEVGEREYFDKMYKSGMMDINFDMFEEKRIPIKSAKTMRNSQAPLEPEAEMLPAHYTGVKPPGVDHMELKYEESQIVETVPKHPIITTMSKGVDLGGGSQLKKSNQAIIYVKGEQGHGKVRTIEKARKGNIKKENKKKINTEAGGQKKTHSNNDNNSKHYNVEGQAEDGAKYANKVEQEKSRKATGYRNVYHKDERNKDADFYDNDHHGGHFKKHGRYKGKYTIAEGSFGNGGSFVAGFDEAQQGKKGASEKARVIQEAKGHDARQGHDEYFKNFQGFANQADGAEGGKFGLKNGKVR